jgi:hypothetical protein
MAAKGISDSSGRQVPLKVVPAFQTAEELVVLSNQVDAILNHIQALLRRPGGDLIQNAVSHRHQARKALLDGMPREVCWACSGNDPRCAACRGRGWLPSGESPLHPLRTG